MLLIDRRLKGRFFVQSLCTRVGASLSLEVLGVQNSLALSPEKKEAPTKAAELAMLHRCGTGASGPVLTRVARFARGPREENVDGHEEEGLNLGAHLERPRPGPEAAARTRVQC